jgi:copper resistance protein D
LTAALIVVRFVHFASVMALFGASVFLALLAPTSLRRALAPRFHVAGVAAALIAAAMAVLWLMLEGGEMGGEWGDATDPAVISSVLYETAFGFVWQARLALALAVVGVALWRTSPPMAGVVLNGAFLASLGLVGHAAMREGASGLFERANQALHLLAGGFWLGALAPLFLSLAYLDNPALRVDAAAALRRFSGLGHVAVALVLATGVTNVFLILGKWPLDFSSPYQASLAMKIACVAAMTLLALYNRYGLVPRLGAASKEALRALRRNTLLELALGGAVLALVSAFATFEPA